MRKSLIWALIGLFLWIGCVRLRPFVIHPHALPPVPAMDRPGLGFENSSADLYSYWTQNTSGILAATVPVAYELGLVTTGALALPAALSLAGADLLSFTQTWFWNGAATEAIRLVVQRPRPFVYADPSRAGDPQNYTSFVSGHTSFAAATCVFLVLFLFSRGAPRALLYFGIFAGEALVLSTAVFRILAGRHFLSDTIGGAAVGTLTALVVYSLHRKKA